MVSRSFLAVCSLTAAFCLHAAAQSSGAQSTASPAQQPAAPTPTQSQPQTSPAPLRLESLPPDPHTPTPAELAQQHEQQEMAAAMRLAGLQARWGPPMSTPGLSITLNEVGRTKTAEGTTQLRYQISGSGFTPGEKLSLVRWPLDTSAQTLMGGIGFDAKGVAVCAPAGASSAAPAAAAPTPNGAAATPAVPPPPSCTSTMHPNQPVEIQTTAAQGEAVRVALIGEDRRHGAATSVVPFPIAGQDKGCKLQVLLGVKNAGLVLVEGTGFPPDTSVNLESITLGQTRTMNPKTNAEGKLVVMVLPAAPPGTTAGETTVRFAGVNHPPSLKTPATPPPADPGCAPSVTFHWGKGTYKAD